MAKAMHFGAKFPRLTRAACKRFDVPLTRDRYAVTCMPCLKSPDFYQQTKWLDRCKTCGNTRSGTSSHFDSPGSLRAHPFVLDYEFNPIEHDDVTPAAPLPTTSPAPLRIYAASRASVPARPAMWRKLRDLGVNIVSSWIDEAGPGETASMSDLWSRVVREITTCDRLVLYVENGDFPLKGALVEAGIAFGSGVPVYVVAPGVLIAPDWRPIGSWLALPTVTLETNLLNALGPFACSTCGSEGACGHKEAAAGLLTTEVA